MKTLKELNEALDSNIPRSAVKQREGAGRRTFSYLSTDYVIDRNNKLFGNLNWASDTLENKAVFEGKVSDSYGKEKHHVSYIARVKVEVQHIDETGRVVRTSHTGTGYGDGSDATNPGKAHELAAKEAESDALKRACKNLGQSMGLALYDKDQTNVEDDSQKVPPSSPIPQTPSTSSEGHKANPPIIRSSADGAPSNREILNKSINAHSKIVIAKSSDQSQAKEKLKADMRAKYGTDKKEELSDAQASEFLAELKVQASA